MLTTNNEVNETKYKDTKKLKDIIQDDDEVPGSQSRVNDNKVTPFDFRSNRTKSGFYSAARSKSQVIDELLEDQTRRADAKTIRLSRNYNYFVMLPDDWYSQLWNLLISIILLFTFFATPYRIAFVDKDDEAMLVIDYCIDAIFAIDIILNFFIAYYDSDYILVDKRKDIALHYIRTWFIIDFIAIIPFNFIFQTSDFNSLARLSKIPRLYRLIRMFRLVRLLKVARRKSELSKYLGQLATIGVGIERLLIFFVTFFLFCHIIACVWVMIYKFEDNQPETWVYLNDFQDLSNYDLYVRAVYFTVTTITTVGFGDISPGTNIEMKFGVVVMISGVIAFSYATGALSSIISNIDDSTAILKEKIEVLDGIRERYNIGPALYEELRQSIQYEASRDVSNVIEFVEKLPYRLKIELSVKIHRETVMTIPFFNEKPREFIAFVGPLLRSLRFHEGTYIYLEDYPINKVYFLTSGAAGYVLPEFQNVVYITIDKGDVFGLIEAFGGSVEINTMRNKREFTIMALDECETMTLNIENLMKVQESFPEIYHEFTHKASQRYKKVVQHRQVAMRNAKRSKFLGTIKTMHVLDAKNKELKKILNKFQVIPDYYTLERINEEAEEDSDSFRSSYIEQSESDKSKIDEEGLPHQDELIITANSSEEIQKQNEKNEPDLKADIVRIESKIDMVIEYILQQQKQQTQK